MTTSSSAKTLRYLPEQTQLTLVGWLADHAGHKIEFVIDEDPKSSCCGSADFVCGCRDVVLMSVEPHRLCQLCIKNYDLQGWTVREDHYCYGAEDMPSCRDCDFGGCYLVSRR